MKLTKDTSEIFIPDGGAEEQALESTSIMAVGAHQDDVELLAYNGVLRAFENPKEMFSAVITTNGSGSAREDVYADYSDEDMCSVRRKEQKKAATVGEYASTVFLDYPSSEVKTPQRDNVINDLVEVFRIAKPHTIYTHNPADKHTTHVGVVLSVLEAIRQLSDEWQPKELHGCEVWRDLDWLCDEEKVTLPVDRHDNLAGALAGVFDSQICGGKRYDLAVMGRRRANATFLESHATDETDGLTFAMDLMPLVNGQKTKVADYVQERIDNFRQDVMGRLDKLQNG